MYSPGGRSIRNVPSAAEVTRATTAFSPSSTTSCAAYGVTHGTGSLAPGVLSTGHVGPSTTMPWMPDGDDGVSKPGTPTSSQAATAKTTMPTSSSRLITT